MNELRELMNELRSNPRSPSWARLPKSPGDDDWTWAYYYKLRAACIKELAMSQYDRLCRSLSEGILTAEETEQALDTVDFAELHYESITVEPDQTKIAVVFAGRFARIDGVSSDSEWHVTAPGFMGYIPTTAGENEWLWGDYAKRNSIDPGDLHMSSVIEECYHNEDFEDVEDFMRESLRKQILFYSEHPCRIARRA